ncbi:hypothetical protein [Acinetobacter colistiniresistens]|uniref:hypothetical protein n=1 Tax=Acinetobacter colistiniresistens TaxID=280145 RepID=UPI00124F7C4B|nr:hypothetical protein [Acinetobacter colistiniresistens]
MGWKTFKEHFGIEHTVQITDAGLCIGSAYVHNIVTIDLKTGEIRQSNALSGFLNREYPQVLNSTAEERLQLINAKDHFEKSITIYTYQGGEIIEKLCEDPKWPHLTHDGRQIYENTHSINKDEVVVMAKREFDAAQKMTLNRINEIKQQLQEVEGDYERYKIIGEKLERDYPGV